MLEVADVWRRYGRESLDRCEPDLLPSHRRAMVDLLACRTEVLGGQLWPCEPWGQDHDVYHACHHRRCPTCHRLATDAWLEDRRRELLPVPYFHVVLTLPQELRELVRRHQNDLYDIWLRAAAHARITLAADPHDVGGLIGVLCVLHTWRRTLPTLRTGTAWSRPVGSPLLTLRGGPPAPPPWCPSRPSRSSVADGFGRWGIRNSPT
jgi:Transposase zinc-binding domain